MTVVTYSQARQRLAALLDIANRGDKVLIKRKDGQLFTLSPLKDKKSPLSVKGVDVNISSNEIVDVIRELREKI